MKKIISFICIAALVFAVSSCSDSSTKLLAFIDPSAEEITFDGMTFRILSLGNSGEGLEYIAEGESPSERKELFIKRMDEIETKYNCVIVNEADLDTNYATYYISGIPRADLLQSEMLTAYGMYQQGYFIPMNKIPNIDISSGKYGTESFLDAYTWNGDLIGFWPMYWGYVHMGFSDGMYYNPVIFTEIGQPTPNERYEQGTWDWNSLQEISDACQAISEGNDPKYLTALNSYFPRMLIRSNGGQFVKVDENGKYYYGLNSPEVVEAMQFANDLLKEGAIDSSNSDHGYVTANFGAGRYAFMCEYDVYYHNYIMGMSEGLGVCYAPKGPRAESHVTTGLMSIFNSIWYVTQEKNEYLDSVGKFLEILLEPIDGDTEAWKQEYLNMNFLDETSGQVFLSQMLNKDFDRVIFAYDNTILFDMIEKAVKYGTIAESVQKYTQTVNTKLDESINTWND